jgi:putative membrane protein
VDPQPLSETQRDEVRRAVAEVERASGAELVPVIVASSDAYRVADWRAAVAGALAGGVAHAAAPDLAGWGLLAPYAPLAWTALGALGATLAARWHRLRRLLAGDAELAARVAAGARSAFLANEVFRTRDRTGVLIYVSLFERRVEILADEGVYRAVPQPEWERLAEEVAATMKGAAPEAAMLAAIRRAGELVAAHGPRRRDDDANELPDSPITG